MRGTCSRPTRRALAVLGTLGALLCLAACATTGDTSFTDVPSHDVHDVHDVSDTDADVACPDACPPGQTCVRGHCTTSTCGSGGCPAGETCCASVCVNTRTDSENCGACGTVCAPQGDSCFAGTCSCNGAAACSAERSCCPGLGCIDTMGDPAHCGGCTTACPEDTECLGGACGGSCITGCPDVPHGRTACAGEECAISECDSGWADVDGVVGNGCECAVTAEPAGGESCDTAIDLGTIDDSGESLTAEGSIVPADDQDWFRFTATDTQPAGCDRFYVDVRFAENPEEQFAFEVFVGDCATNMCAGDVLFSYATDFIDTTGPEIRGECPCATTNTAGKNTCMDSSQTFYVRVRRVSVSSGGTCDGYSLIITNGTYSTP